MTTLAGNILAGFADGKGREATFTHPGGVAVDSSGNVYVADTENQLIRKITADGVVSTLAGSAGVTGESNGTGTAASFNHPTGVAVDSSGNVYVADSNNNRIRKITPTGVVTTLAGSGSVGSGNGTGTFASFNWPRAVAVDSSGNVYVADAANRLIRKITHEGVVTTLAGSGSQGSSNGQGTSALFNQIWGIAVDSPGNVYVADTFNHLIRKITPAGLVSTLAGSGAQGSANGTGPAAAFSYPAGVAVDASGIVYIADYHDFLIRKITAGGVVTTLAGTGSPGAVNGIGTDASFNKPTGIAADSSGTVYIADTFNNLIRKIQ